jgi:DNA replication protein DnaC
MDTNRGSPYDRLLQSIETGTNGIRELPPTATAQYDLGAWITCPRCQTPIQLRETKAAWKGKRLRYWSDCRCIGLSIEAAERAQQDSARYQAQARGITSDLAAIRRYTFDTFDGSRYPAGTNPLFEARSWLDAALPESVADYEQGAVCCLFLYSARKGTGKTHLAGAIANAAEAAGRLVSFADEIAFIDRYWAADFEARETLANTAGHTAWLTVVDDLGQRENAPASLRDAWYDVLNRRYLRRGWTVITSNYTPPELLARGTINEATYSRIAHMTHSVIIPLDSSDYRMESRA